MVVVDFVYIFGGAYLPILTQLTPYLTHYLTNYPCIYMYPQELSKGPQYDEGEYEEDEDEEALEAARELLSKNEEIKSVHSAKSASVLFKNAKDNVNSNGNKSPKVFNEPIIAVHDPNEGTRLDADAKNAVSNMPYMHRNPAI